jgi:prevent-host-death family protein
MKTLEVSAANTELCKMVDDAREGTLVLTQAGRPVAALVSIDAADAESLAMGKSVKFQRIVQRSIRELEAGRGVTLAEMRKRVLRRG